MHKSKEELWRRFQQYYTAIPSLGLALDLSRMNFPDDYFQTEAPRRNWRRAYVQQLTDGFAQFLRFLHPFY